MGLPPLTNRNVIHFLLFVNIFCQKNFATIFHRFLCQRDLLPNVLIILGNRACCWSGKRGIKSRYRIDPMT
nr:MAG TPA_asm: hypothetical protein [Caudoviricetes sp.]